MARISHAALYWEEVSTIPMLITNHALCQDTGIVSARRTCRPHNIRACTK